jgi:AbrB family looped-hinge helix DNA binding protein
MRAGGLLLLLRCALAGICHNYVMESCIVKNVILDDRVKLNENGRIVIPAAMREALQIKPGDELLLHVEDGELHVTTRMQRIRRAQELVRKHLGPNPDLVDGFIAERREAAKRE